jgi:hypothetical protein
LAVPVAESMALNMTSEEGLCVGKLRHVGLGSDEKEGPGYGRFRLVSLRVRI